MKDRTRNNRLLRIKTKENKKLRIKRKHEDLLRDEQIARKERAKREGVYKSGVNMQDEDLDDDAGQQPNAAARNNRRSNKNIICPHCHLKGHSTTRSRKCLLYNNGNGVQELPDLNGTVDPAEDVDRQDLTPFAFGLNERDTEADTEAFNAFLADLANGNNNDDEVELVRAKL
jgi:hypothetical protein